MKTIELKTTKEMVVVGGKHESEIEISVSDLIKTACNNPVKGGFTASDMVNRVRILDFLEAANKKTIETPLVVSTEPVVGVLELEDADYKNLAAMVAETKWAVVSKEILAFVQSFETKK